jgi:putative sigma-54 modulation protein
MELTIRPKNFKLAPGTESHIRKRLERLPRHLDNLESAEVILTQEPTHLAPQRVRYVAQLTLHTKNNLIRSEVANPELLTAVDEAVDHLSRQIERLKGRFYRKGRPGLGKSSAEVVAVSSEAPSVVEMARPARVPERNAPRKRTRKPEMLRPDGLVEDDEIGSIVKIKRFGLKPMYPDEAIEQMELLGHSFFIFWNAGEERMNVVYRRKDGDYGLLQPELS